MGRSFPFTVHEIEIPKEVVNQWPKLKRKK